METLIPAVKFLIYAAAGYVLFGVVMTCLVVLALGVLIVIDFKKGL